MLQAVEQDPEVAVGQVSGGGVVGVAAFAAVVAVLIVLQAIDGFSTKAKTAGPAVTPPPAGGTAEIPIKDFAFPDNVAVAVGTKAKWTNQDGGKHTVTASDGSFDSGKLTGGTSYEFTFTKAGTFTYACQLHETMKGTVTVT